EDAEDETVDAIGDHNDIRDGVRVAAQHPVGAPQWWEGVRRTRMANSEHMAEEEDEALADFRRNSPSSLRDELGRRILEFKSSHADADDLDTDKDPREYVSEVEAQMSSGKTGAPGTGG